MIEKQEKTTWEKIKEWFGKFKPRKQTVRRWLPMFIGIITMVIFLISLLIFKDLLELRIFDVALLIANPFFCALGSLTKSVIHQGKLDLDKQEKTQTRGILSFNEYIQTEYILERIQAASVWNNTFTAFVLGAVIALYFAGGMADGFSPVAKILAFSTLIGYQSQNIWGLQEKFISKLVEEKFKEEMQTSKNEGNGSSEKQEKSD